MRLRETPTDGVVVLTPFVASDAPVLRDADKDPEQRLRFGFPKDFVPSTEHSLAVVSRWQRQREAGTRLTFAVRDAAAGTLLGGCELLPLGSSLANLSYWTYPAHRNRGIASRAAAIAVRLAFADLKMARLEVVVDSDNHYSRKVALRNGFRELGTRGSQVCYVLDNSLAPETG